MERLYHYLWKHKIIGTNLHLVDGEKLNILFPGTYNEDAGPDFYNARIIIGETEWIGNVEIHVKASDWYRHKHDEDPVYDSVLLHVVGINDTKIERKNGEIIPQFLMTYPQPFYSLYESLSCGVGEVRCAPWIKLVPRLVNEDWLESLALERLQQKAQRILDCAENCRYDWEQTTFIALARALGFGLNSEPFERLARSLPLNFIRRHSNNLMQLEALLFGQAGMLDTSIHIFDQYYQTLCQEYFFLARKYGLRPLDVHIWKYARTRPQNFPHRRIALLARALYNGFNLNSSLRECSGDLNKIKCLFNWELSGYWLNHLDFDQENPLCGKILGKGSIELVCINFVVPLLYAMAKFFGDPDLGENAIRIWEKLDAERNRYIDQWKRFGFECKCAMRSQALIQLRKEYCDCSRCMECRIGHWLLRDRVKHPSTPISLNQL